MSSFARNFIGIHVRKVKKNHLTRYKTNHADNSRLNPGSDPNSERSLPSVRDMGDNTFVHLKLEALLYTSCYDYCVKAKQKPSY